MHCLVVGDSAVIRKVARRILEDLQWTVVEAEDGPGALDVCRRLMPDAILLDWSSGSDGATFLRSLRKEVSGGDRPKIVLCTSELDVVQIARAKRAGADDYLLKPFDREVIEQKLHELGFA